MYSLPQKLIVSSDDRRLAVISRTQQVDTIIIVEKGASLQLDVIVIGDSAGAIDMQLPIMLAGE